MIHSTTRDTVKLLCKSIVNRLENGNAIELEAENRSQVESELVKIVGPHILTEQDLRERTLESLGARADDLVDSSFTETEQFRTARRVVRSQFGDDELNGLYFQRNIKTIAELAVKFFMDSPHIDEVFHSDDDLVKAIVQIVRKFRPAELH